MQNTDQAPGMTDVELVAAINSGDDLAFDNMAEHYHPILVKYAQDFRKLSREEAEDIVQDIFLRLWEKHDSWNTTNVIGYFRSAVRNEAIDIYHSNKKKQTIESELLIQETAIPSSPSADSSALNNELIKVFDDAVNSLPPRDRIIYNLHVAEDLLPEQIGPRLNISGNIARRSLQNTRTFLATHLSKLGWTEPLERIERYRRRSFMIFDSI